MNTKLLIWAILALLSTACAGVQTVADNITKPRIDPETGEPTTLVDQALGGTSVWDDAQKYGIGGSVIALLGGVASIISDRRKNSRKRGEVHGRVNETNDRIAQLEKQVLSNGHGGKL